MKKGLSIRFKILALLLSLVIFPSAILAISSYSISSKSLESEMKSSLDGVTANIEGSLDFLLSSYANGLDILSKNQSIRDVLVNQQDFFFVLKYFADNHADLLNVYIGTVNKDFYVLPHQQIPEGFDPTSRAWYQDAVSKKGITWTDPYTDALTGKMVVTVATPVYNGDTLVGVVGADLALDQLVNMVVSFKVGEKGYFFLTDTQGNVIAHKEAKEIGKPIPIETLLQAAKSDVKKDTLEYVYNNQKKFSAFTTIERTGWKLFGTFDYSEVTSKTSVILRGAAIISLALILIAGALGIFFSAPMLKGIKSLSQDMQVIGNGDFTVRSKIRSKDEIGLLSHTLNKMAIELSGIMNKIKAMATDVSASSNSLAATSEEATATTDEISRTIQEIVRVTEDQAFNTEDGLKKTTQLAEKIQGVSQEISRIIDTVKASSELNERGQKTVSVLKEASDASSSASNMVGGMIYDVDKSSEKIGVIVDTMTSIAEQTNLLALNASIEAARAGESGRGFTVVANEIRKLAEQSAGAANEIRHLIGDIQEQSKKAVSTMDSTKPVMEDQNHAVAETESVFNEISRAIDKLNDEVAIIIELNNSMIGKKDEILSTMESISASAEQTSASTEQIAASTHEQLAAADEVAKTAEQLNSIAQSLSKEVSRFKS